MKILVINAGSSSVKFTLFAAADEAMLAKGVVERIGAEGTQLHYENFRGESVRKPVAVNDTTAAVNVIYSFLHDEHYGVIGTSGKLVAIGHRVVHGGESLTQSVIIDAAVKKIIADCAILAPLHNPPNLKGIEACEKTFPEVPQVAVFDTAFHATIPDHAHLYALPYDLYRKYGIRRYGFHGISHKFVAEEAARMLKRPVDELKTITCHLGNGCSITAVSRGRSIDTSMGFTPLEGLIMGTRSGDLDPAVVLFLQEQGGLDVSQLDDLLNKRSGLLGLSGTGSNDVRDILAARDRGDAMASVAVKAFCYRVKKYIGAYLAALGGLDVLVFTAGIGENSPEIRSMICAGLEYLTGPAIMLDPSKNQELRGKSGPVHHDKSGVKILVIKTNEELEIARQVKQIVGLADISR